MVSRKIEPDLPKENGNTLETKGEDVPISAFGDVSVYDEWIVPRVSGKPPKSRYEVLSLFLLLKFDFYA